MEILDAIDRYGLPLLIIVLVATFTKRDLWPFFKEQITKWQSDRETERNHYLDTLARFAEVADTGHAARAERDRQLYDQLDKMAHAIAELAIIIRETRRPPDQRNN